MHIRGLLVAARLPRFLLAGAGGLVGWIAVLSATLGTSATVRHWDISWIGLDSAEVVGLVATALLIQHRPSAVVQVATMTATLFLVDAWFDITLSAPGWTYAGAMISACLLEIPLAVLCLRIAWQHSHTQC